MTNPLYTEDLPSALEAQRRAQEIVFGPVAFQVARILRKLGALALLADPARSEGMTLDELCAALGRSRYPVQVLIESALGSGILYRRIDGECERYCLTKTGVVLNADRMTGVLIDFMQNVCYEGMLDLEKALGSGEPEGLRRVGPWHSIYEGLARLPVQMRESWLRYDHYFSDCTFAAALKIVLDPPPRTLLDLGGNTGRWALQCVAADSAVRVTVMDLPQQIGLMEEEVRDRPGAERITGLGIDFLSPDARIPDGFDVLWMSQFLDCFAEEDIVRILRLAASAMDIQTPLYINEICWDRQRFETASYVLTQSSPYFTAIANGRSKFLYYPDLLRCIERAGLAVERCWDGLGWGHTLIRCRRSG